MATSSSPISAPTSPKLLGLGLAGLLALAGGPASAASRAKAAKAAKAAVAEPPAAAALLASALKDPDTAYQGRMLVTQWVDRRARAIEIEVSYAPPDRYRWDFIGQDGGVERRAVSDGDLEYVYLMSQGKVLAGDAVKSTSKMMTPERESELLLKNYAVSVEGADTSAGRPVWVLQLRPLEPGKLMQKLWVDQASGVVLEVRRFRAREGGKPAKGFSAYSRFTRFEPKASLPDEVFALGTDTASVTTDPALAPDFLSLDDLRSGTGKPVALPEELPGGFAFESADYFDLKGQTVRHLRYTDGLAVLSLFETDKPVRPPRGGAAGEFLPVNVMGSLRLSGGGGFARWQRGRQYYTLMGDVSQDLLQSVAASLKQHYKKTAKH